MHSHSSRFSHRGRGFLIVHPVCDGQRPKAEDGSAVSFGALLSGLRWRAERRLRHAGLVRCLNLCALRHTGSVARNTASGAELVLNARRTYRTPWTDRTAQVRPHVPSCPAFSPPCPLSARSPLRGSTSSRASPDR